MQNSDSTKSSTVIFSEVQYLPIWHAVLALLVTSSLGVAYGSAVSVVWGWMLGSVMSAIAIWLWFQKRIKIEITSKFLKVGKFTIEKEFIGQVLVLDQNDFLSRIRSGAHRNDVFVLRNYSNGGMAIEIKDSRDPFCHWVVSSKHPSKLAKAMVEGRESND